MKMRNPHRVYEVDYFNPAEDIRPAGTFLSDFGELVDQFLNAPSGYEDPRKRVNMSPEPYRPDESLQNQPDRLKQRALDLVGPNLSNWTWLYERLSDFDSKRLLLLVLAYRALGWRYVRLPLDNEIFWSALKEIGQRAEKNGVPDFILKKGMQRFDLRRFDRNLTVYSDPFGVFNEFVYPQYHYRGWTAVITPEPGDYVLDCGACYGGTTLNFADMVGPRGKVFSFEFLPDNTDLYRSNLHGNIDVLSRISLVERPVWSQSDLSMSVVGKGPATQVHFAEIKGAQKVQSLKIDDFVFNNGLPRLNFIKMDIEGAEIEALKGAMRTIEKYRPKMAIAVYHKLSDFYEVPRFLSGIHEDYRIYFGHSTAHGDESVIFAV